MGMVGNLRILKISYTQVNLPQHGSVAPKDHQIYLSPVQVVQLVSEVAAHVEKMLHAPNILGGIHSDK